MFIHYSAYQHMIKLRVSLTITTIASIMIIAGFVSAPDAFSSKNNDVPDECKCEKPDTLKVKFTAPIELPSTDLFKIEIYKKLDDRGNPDKLLGSITDVVSDTTLTIEASFGKDKLESNTAFVVYNNLEEVVAEMEIHTSCSKPLFITQKVFDVNVPNNGYSLEVIDGLIGENRSIPEFEPNSCEDEKKKSTGTITIRKALTNDSGGTAKVEDFKITVTNVDDTPFDLDPTDDPYVSTRDVPAGTYKLSETELDGYTTVLIAGDTGCPSMVDEVFTIKKGKTLSCTIYNDDDGTGDNGEVEPGVIFHFGTVTFDNVGSDSVLRCDDKVLDLPCVWEDDMGLFSIVPKLKPTESLHETTLVLMSVVGLFADNTNDPGAATGCTFDGLTSFTEIIDDGDDIIHPSFRIQCSPLSSIDKIFRVNYALIETQI